MGAWIETFAERKLNHEKKVAPLVGAWIETAVSPNSADYLVSHPSWVRGLKHATQVNYNNEVEVAPLVGAWIETLVNLYNKLCSHVAPLVGAWIETGVETEESQDDTVAPLVGAWIETLNVIGCRKV